MEDDLSGGEKILFTAAYVILITVSLLGNSLTIDIVRRYKSMRSRPNILIVNQACADLVVTLLFMPAQVKRLYLELLWVDGTFGLVLCKVVLASQYVSSCASVYSLLAIAADRYYAVVHPLRLGPVARHLKKIIPGIWLITMFNDAIIFVLGDLTLNSKGQSRCILNMWKLKRTTSIVVVTLNILLGIVFPIVAIVTLFVITGRRLWTRTIPGDGDSADMRRRKVKKTNVKITKMMIIVVTLFLLCWLPFTILLTIRVKASYQIYLFTILLANSYSALNPCVYLLYLSSYRQKLKLYFSQCFQQVELNRVGISGVRLNTTEENSRNQVQNVPVVHHINNIINTKL